MSQVLSIKRALISVYNKSGLTELAAFLRAEQVLVISTGNTAQFLREQGVIVTDVSVVGQFPEILDGRVKTLNPRIYAGILCDRDKPTHCRTLEELDIAPIDLVVANLYPFAEVAASPDATMEHLIEHIDIGGPSMLRAAAKNCASVVTLHRPEQYAEFMAHYQRERGTTRAYRAACAREVFAHTAQYDQTIAQELSARETNQTSLGATTLELFDQRPLRYGENPHQEASVSTIIRSSDYVRLSAHSSLGGKELSYNNLLDAHAAIWALRCLMDYQQTPLTGAVVIKHGVPCGAALAHAPFESIKKAIASDEKSAFGGIIGLSAPFDEACAKIIADGFFEVVIAPSFTDDAQNVLARKKNLRLLAINNLMTGSLPTVSYRSIMGGLLAQTHDTTKSEYHRWSVVTQKMPSTTEKAAADFAFRLAIATPSNAITIASPDHLFGVGAGQPNRIQSALLAISGARERGFDLTCAALASDAFFPFDDCVRVAHEHGINMIIQPGGSIRDEDVISTANQLGLCMIFTHRRHFRH